MSIWSKPHEILEITPNHGTVPWSSLELQQQPSHTPNTWSKHGCKERRAFQGQLHPLAASPGYYGRRHCGTVARGTAARGTTARGTAAHGTEARSGTSWEASRLLSFTAWPQQAPRGQHHHTTYQQAKMIEFSSTVDKEFLPTVWYSKTEYLSTSKFLIRPPWWWAEAVTLGWYRVKASENLGVTGPALQLPPCKGHS